MRPPFGIACALLLTTAACGSGTVTVVDAAPTNYVDLGAGPIELPFTDGYYQVEANASDSHWVVDMGTEDRPCEAAPCVWFLARILNSAPGTYPCKYASSYSQLVLTVDGLAQSADEQDSCTLTISELGDIGGRIRGSVVGDVASATIVAAVFDLERQADR